MALDLIRLRANTESRSYEDGKADTQLTNLAATKKANESQAHAYAQYL